MKQCKYCKNQLEEKNEEMGFCFDKCRVYFEGNGQKAVYYNKDGSLNMTELERMFNERGISKEYLMKQYQEMSLWLRKKNKINEN
jgi:hypothetical protein